MTGQNRKWREKLKRAICLRLIVFSMIMWLIQVTTGLLTKFLPVSSYMAIWILVMLFFVLLPALGLDDCEKQRVDADVVIR